MFLDEENDPNQEKLAYIRSRLELHIKNDSIAHIFI